MAWSMRRVLEARRLLARTSLSQVSSKDRQPGRCAICGSTRHSTSQCTHPVKPKAKNAEWDESNWYGEEDEWHDPSRGVWGVWGVQRSKGKKGKGKGSKPKGKVQRKECAEINYFKAITVLIFERRPIPSQSQTWSTLLYDKWLPLRHDVYKIQAHMETFYMEWTWLHGLHCCRTTEEASSIQSLATWSLTADSRISLYGHDAKTMKQFTLHFNMAEQCDSLDRAWFGEMWFPVQKHTYHVQSSATYDSIPDPADLDLDEGYSEPELMLLQISSSRPCICTVG